MQNILVLVVFLDLLNVMLQSYKFVLSKIQETLQLKIPKKILNASHLEMFMRIIQKKPFFWHFFLSK